MATAEKELTTSYVELITGPCLITLEEGPIAEIHIASSAPAADAPAHRLQRDSDRQSMTYTGSDKVYGKKTDPTGTRTVKVAYTGV